MAAELERDLRGMEFPCDYSPSKPSASFHDDDCNALSDAPMYVCPARRLYDVKRRLARLKTRPLLALAFSNPDMTVANELLDGEGVVMSHQYVPRHHTLPSSDWLL
jgi:hypothetical protein